jgi:hypothetical protein
LDREKYTTRDTTLAAVTQNGNALYYAAAELIVLVAVFSCGAQY